MAHIDDLITQGDQLFSKRGQLLSLWQVIGEEFYPERADFTTVRNLGAEFATNLVTSYPILARRDLGNTIGSMLRPTSKAWFHARTTDYDNLGPSAQAWLQGASDRMRIAMHSQRSQFARATKEGDHDFAAFGQACIQTSLNSKADGLLYRCWHLRDVAWVEDVDGQTSTVFRKWKPTARDICALFPKTAHEQVRRCLEKEPYKEFECIHCIMPAENYNGDKKYNTPFVSVYYDKANKTIMEEVGLKMQEYTIPRWSTVSGSQYAYSPATVAALPDARLLQAMTRVLLEAGEKAVNPPMIAVQEALRSDISIYAGGVTWVDAAYDERLGEVLRPLTNQDRGAGITLGDNMANRVHSMLAEAFFLNKIALPAPGADMTAFEVGQRVQEYIRQAMPLFEPMESDYNSPLCDKTFQLMLRSGAFGSPFDMPEELHGASVEFSFESPLHDAIEREKGQRFMEASSMIAQAMALDPNSGDVLDAGMALRDVLTGIGVPAKWTRSADDMDAMKQQRLQAQQSAEMLAQMQQGADVSKTLNEAQRIAPQAPAGGIAP